MKFFTVGPAELYPGCEKHYREAFLQQIPSTSHRSHTFRKIYQETDEALRELMNIPSTHEIYFTASATEIWEKMIGNLVETNSFHLVQGAFSKRFYEFAQLMGKRASEYTVADGQGFSAQPLPTISPDTELICVTQNETATGIQVPVNRLQHLKKQLPLTLLCTDIVSSVPYVDLDFNLVDSAFFSVQKGMGMPAGLGVWIVNAACLEKSKRLEEQNKLIGAHFRLSSFHSNYTKWETPSTPNTTAIYVLGKIVRDMLNFGVGRIRLETDTKYERLTSFLQEQDIFTRPEALESDYSRTTFVLNTTKSSSEVNAYLAAQGMKVASGYGSHKEHQIRIANFPSSTVEEMEQLLHHLKHIM
jgi:phosphoserine aminotransferase